MRRLLLAACPVAALATLIVAAPATARDAYAKYYQAYAANPVAVVREPAPPELIESSRDLDRDIALMWQRGYRAIGHSSFTAEKQDPKDALKLASAIRARYVVLCQSCDPASDDPARESSYDGGYDQEAVFFAPLEKSGSGLLVRDVTADERDALGKNGAVAVIAVRNGSPASAAGLVAGDMVLSANDIRAIDPDVWNRLFLVADAPIRLAFSRGGRRYDVLMTIPLEWRVGRLPKGQRRAPAR